MAAAMQRDGGKEGQLEEENKPLQLTSGWRLYPAGRLTGFSRPLGRDQVLDEDLKFQSVRHHLHHFV